MVLNLERRSLSRPQARRADLPRPAGSREPRLRPPERGRPGRTASRVLDLLVATVGLVLVAPVMAAIAVLVRCTSRGPALFRQERLGKDRQPFVMLKFRTMYADCDDRLHREYVRRVLTEPAETTREAGLYKLADDPRITPLGQWLRGTSLDELPQLLNVLRGQMAIVGLRPALAWEADLFADRHARRFEVPPGITGLWQTSGRNHLTMTEALDLDVRYVERRSLALDITIILHTLPVVLGRDGVR